MEDRENAITELKKIFKTGYCVNKFGQKSFSLEIDFLDQFTANQLTEISNKYSLLWFIKPSLINVNYMKLVLIPQKMETYAN